MGSAAGLQPGHAVDHHRHERQSARTVANLGWEEIRLLAPVFVGDTLYAESEFLERRLSASRPTMGIVTCATRGHKADGTVFLTCRRTFLLPTREHPADENY